MKSVAKRTISLPEEHSAFIDAKVASGAYGSASGGVRAGLRALQERDAAIERWLREEVVPTYEQLKANPESAISTDEMRALMKAHHEQALERGVKG